MNRKTRGSIASGIILILLGGLFLLNQFRPTFLRGLFGENFTWPWIVIGVGVIFLLAALLSVTGGLAVPGTIITGIGAILYYQNATGNWASWSYIWPLVPGLVGLGIFLSALLGDGGRKEIRSGLTMLVICVALFFILWSLFTAKLDVNLIWPVILIAFGLWVLIRGLTRSRG